MCPLQHKTKSTGEQNEVPKTQGNFTCGWKSEQYGAARLHFWIFSQAYGLLFKLSVKEFKKEEISKWSVHWIPGKSLLPSLLYLSIKLRADIQSQRKIKTSTGHWTLWSDGTCILGSLDAIKSIHRRIISCERAGKEMSPRASRCNYLPSYGRSYSHLCNPFPHFKQSTRIEQIGKQSEVYLLFPNLSFQTRAIAPK